MKKSEKLRARYIEQLRAADETARELEAALLKELAMEPGAKVKSDWHKGMMFVMERCNVSRQGHYPDDIGYFAWVRPDPLPKNEGPLISPTSYGFPLSTLSPA